MVTKRKSSKLPSLSSRTPSSSAPSSPALHSRNPSLAAANNGSNNNVTRDQQRFASKQPTYKAPTLLGSPLEYARGLWQLYEATFAISMLETWESILIHAVLIAVTYLIYWAGRAYLPDHVRVITSRAKYYLYGPEELSW